MLIWRGGLSLSEQVAAPAVREAWRFIKPAVAAWPLRWWALRRSCASMGLAVHRGESLRLPPPLACSPLVAEREPLRLEARAAQPALHGS